MLLCAARVRFFFFEMDVWMPPKATSLLDVFRDAAGSWTVWKSTGGSDRTGTP